MEAGELDVYLTRTSNSVYKIPSGTKITKRDDSSERLKCRLGGSTEKKQKFRWSWSDEEVEVCRDVKEDRDKNMQHDHQSRRREFKR